MAHTKPIAVLLAIVITLGPLPAMAQSPKEKLAEIPVGKVVEVKLLEKGSKKITGKLLSISEESFEIQTGQSGSVSSEKILYAAVKSVKKKGMSAGRKALIWTGVIIAGMGIAAAVVLSEIMNN